MIKYVSVRTQADIMAYSFQELLGMNIETVTIDNTILTEDQFTLVDTTFTITESDIKVEDNQLLKIGYQWVKRV